MTITKTNQAFIDKVTLFTKGTQFKQLSDDGAKFTPATLTQALSLWVAEQDEILKRQRKEARAAKKAMKDADSVDGAKTNTTPVSSPKSANEFSQAETHPPSKDDVEQLSDSVEQLSDSVEHLKIDVELAENQQEPPKQKKKVMKKVSKKAATLVPEMLDLSGGDDDEGGEEQLYYVNKISEERWDVYEQNDINSAIVCTFNPEDGTME